MAELQDYATTSPVVFLLVTLLTYRLGLWLRELTGGHGLAQPVLVSIVLTSAFVMVLGVDYDDYREGTGLIAFWLGPATVALAVPLHRHYDRLRRIVLPLVVSVVVGAAASIVSAYWLVRLLGGDDVLATSMAPKAATTPVSIALSEVAGGVPALTAVFTIVAGILGAVVGPAVLSLVRVRHDVARGVALGSVSHGIGTSRALHESETEGAFAGLAMGLTALASSMLLPLLQLFVL